MQLMAMTKGSIKVASECAHEVAKEFRCASSSINLEISCEL